MKGKARKARGRRHQNYIIKPFSGLHLSCGDLYDRKSRTSRVNQWKKPTNAKQQIKKKKKKKTSKVDSLPVAEEYVPHKHSVRHFATQPIEGDVRFIADPDKAPQSLVTNKDDIKTHVSRRDITSSSTNEPTQPNGRTRWTRNDDLDVAPPDEHASDGDSSPPLPEDIGDLLQVYKRTCELADLKMANIEQLLLAPRPSQPHNMMLVSPSEHKDYSDAAEALPDHHHESPVERTNNAGLVLTVKQWAAKMFKAQDRSRSGVITAHEFRRSFQVLEQKLSNLVLPAQSTEAVGALLLQVRDAVLSVAHPGVDTLAASHAIQYDQALSLLDEALIKESRGRY